jgi:hypothetical protein
MARLILLLLVVGAGLWLYKHSSGGLLGSREKDSPSGAPIERARQAARTAEDRQAEIDRLGREAAQPAPAGQIHENMTPAEVRALLGPPDEVTPGYSASGGPRETWVYKSVGKKVVFENGVAVSIE